MKVYVVVSVYAGVIDDVSATTKKEKAKRTLSDTQRTLDIDPNNPSESENAAGLYELDID